MRCSRVMFVSMLALLASCGSKAKDADSSAAAGSTATVVTTAPPPTLATIEAAPAAASAATITPRVVCYDSINEIGAVEPQTDGFYFGYENTGTEPVAIDEGASNHLDATWADDHPLVPTVFAPGEVAVAFLAVADTDNPLPSWTIIGPDGSTNTAQATGQEPACTPELVTPPAPDTRTPTLGFGYRTLPDGAASPEQVEITATLDGLAPASVCAAGLEARPPVVQITDGETTVDGSTATFTYPITTFPAFDGTEATGALTRVTVRVIDECAGAGATTRSWPINETLEKLLDGTSVCAGVDGSAVGPVDCMRLPATGGARVGR